MKYVSLDFHVNYFEDQEPKFRIYGFTVDDPNGSVAMALKDEEAVVTFNEELEAQLDGSAVDAVFGPDEQFWGSHVYELDETQLNLMESAVLSLRDWFLGMGGDIGPIVTVLGGEEVTDHVELKSKLGV